MKNLFVVPTADRDYLGAALLFATLGLAAVARAQAPVSPAGVVKVADFSYRVWASNPASQRGRLRLMDVESGEVLYEKFSREINFGQRFNVRNLPDGHYAFLVKLGPQEYRYALNLSTSSQRAVQVGADTPMAGLL